MKDEVKARGRDCRHCISWLGQYPCVQGYKPSRGWMRLKVACKNFGQDTSQVTEHCFASDCVDFSYAFKWAMKNHKRVKVWTKESDT